MDTSSPCDLEESVAKGLFDSEYEATTIRDFLGKGSRSFYAGFVSGIVANRLSKHGVPHEVTYAAAGIPLIVGGDILAQKYELPANIFPDQSSLDKTIYENGAISTCIVAGGVLGAITDEFLHLFYG